MKRPSITVMTDPVILSSKFFSESARRLARTVKYSLVERKYSSHPRFRGHFAVTRSLIEGLEKIDADFNYNPIALSEVGEIVIVLSGVRTLRQAIDLKKNGKIKRLFAGPNVVHFASDYDSLLSSPEIDAVITPSDWVIDHYVSDCPNLTGRIFSWPAGVDTDYWKPMPNARAENVLIFEKQNKGPVGPVEPYAEYLRAQGWNVAILKYGTFRHQEYLEQLQRSSIMLGFVAEESQGIAWAEAWSADVPTLLLKNSRHRLHGRLLNVSTAPYLCSETGLFFDNFNDFKERFSYWELHRGKFSPRRWVLENMSDEESARNLLARIAEC